MVGLPERLNSPEPLITPERIPTPPGSLIVVVPLRTSGALNCSMELPPKLSVRLPAPLVAKVRTLAMALLPVRAVAAASVPPSNDNTVGPKDRLLVAS